MFDQVYITKWFQISHGTFKHFQVGWNKKYRGIYILEMEQVYFPIVFFAQATMET